MNDERCCCGGIIICEGAGRREEDAHFLSTQCVFFADLAKGSDGFGKLL